MPEDNDEFRELDETEQKHMTRLCQSCVEWAMRQAKAEGSWTDHVTLYFDGKRMHLEGKTDFGNMAAKAFVTTLKATLEVKVVSYESARA